MFTLREVKLHQKSTNGGRLVPQKQSQTNIVLGTSYQIHHHNSVEFAEYKEAGKLPPEIENNLLLVAICCTETEIIPMQAGYEYYFMLNGTTVDQRRYLKSQKSTDWSEAYQIAKNNGYVGEPEDFEKLLKTDSSIMNWDLAGEKFVHTELLKTELDKRENQCQLASVEEVESSADILYHKPTGELRKDTINVQGTIKLAPQFTKYGPIESISVQSGYQPTVNFAERAPHISLETYVCINPAQPFFPNRNVWNTQHPDCPKNLEKSSILINNLGTTAEHQLKLDEALNPIFFRIDAWKEPVNDPYDHMFLFNFGRFNSHHTKYQLTPYELFEIRQNLEFNEFDKITDILEKVPFSIEEGKLIQKFLIDYEILKNEIHISGLETLTKIKAVHGVDSTETINSAIQNERNQQEYTKLSNLEIQEG